MEAQIAVLIFRSLIRFLLDPQTIAVLQAIAEETEDTEVDDIIVGILADARENLEKQSVSE